MGVPCIKLEDTYTGIIYPVQNGDQLTFVMSDTMYTPRFNLILGKNYETTIDHVSCHTGSDGTV